MRARGVSTDHGTYCSLQIGTRYNYPGTSWFPEGRGSVIIIARPPPSRRAEPSIVGARTDGMGGWVRPSLSSQVLADDTFFSLLRGVPKRYGVDGETDGPPSPCPTSPIDPSAVERLS